MASTLVWQAGAALTSVGITGEYQSLSYAQALFFSIFCDFLPFSSRRVWRTCTESAIGTESGDMEHW